MTETDMIFPRKDSTVEPLARKFDTWNLDDFSNEVSAELTPDTVGLHTDILFIRVSHKSMICVFTALNGFVFHGVSACVDPNSFDPEIGAKYALREAVSHVEKCVAYVNQSLQRS